MFDSDEDQEQHRHKCEVRYIVNELKTRHERVEYLKGVEKRRGIAAANRLRWDVKLEWDRKIKK